jgi:hypothetical protein
MNVRRSQAAMAGGGGLHSAAKSHLALALFTFARKTVFGLYVHPLHPSHHSRFCVVIPRRVTLREHVLAWLQIIAHMAQESGWSHVPSVESIVRDMWAKVGR